MPAPERPRPDARTRRAGVRVIHTFAGVGQILEDVWDASPSSSPVPSPGTSPIEVEEEEEDRAADAADAVDAEVEAWQMTTIEQACLEFCVELLNQRHCTHEYESALVVRHGRAGVGRGAVAGSRQLPAHIIAGN
jgi:hypothetical protein